MPRYAHEISALLRSMIWDTPLEIDAAVLLEPGLWHMACRQQMDHMLAVWALNHGLAIPKPAEQKMRVFHTLQRSERQRAILEESVRTLREHEIEPVLIKGQSMAVLYPNPDMRSSADVDMYIGEKNYERMIQVMRAAYPDAYWFSEEHAGLHFAVVMDKQLDLAVELHRVSMEFHSMPRADRAYQDFTHEEMHRTRTLHVGQTDVSIPSLEFDAVYIFMHAWHHFESSGVGLRQLADWVLALNQLTDAEREQFAPRLETLLRRMHMLEVWQVFGWVLVHHLGLAATRFPFYTDACARKGERLFRQLIKDGHCGREPKLQLFGHTLYYFPYQRPETGRLRQKLYTLCRLTFQYFQTRKLFPRYALCNYLGALKKH